MVELVTKNYWWLEGMRDVGRYVEGCDLCQRMKNRMEEVAGKLKLSEVPEKLWTHLTVDFITKLLIVAGKDAILVVCNQLSKMIYFAATTEVSSSQMVDLVFLYFILIFIFFSIYFLTFLFLEYQVRVSDSHESQNV